MALAKKGLVAFAGIPVDSLMTFYSFCCSLGEAPFLSQEKVISNETLTKTNTEVNHTLKNTENLPAACYFLEVQSGDYTTTRKVVVM